MSRSLRGVPSGFEGSVDDLAGKTHHVSDQLGELEDGEVAANADIDVHLSPNNGS